MTTPLVPQFLAPTVRPYVTPAQFSVYPTWLDLDDLVQGGAANVQTDVLNDVLLAATQWAINTVEGMPLHAHLDSRNTRARTNAIGRLVLKPAHIPVRSVVSLSYGWDPTAMAALTLPDSSQWIEDGRSVSYLLNGPGALNFTGPQIQFGRGPGPSWETYVNWTYVAGYVNTTLSALANAGATSLSLTDPTGVLPGDVLRLWDNGTPSAPAVGNEAVTVSPSYVPPAPTWPPTPASVPLASPTSFAHAAGVGITDMPRDILQAIVMYGVGLLMRDDVSSEEPFANAPFGPAARRSTGGGHAGGLISEGERMLAPYRPTRWGN